MNDIDWSEVAIHLGVSLAVVAAAAVVFPRLRDAVARTSTPQRSSS